MIPISFSLVLVIIATVNVLAAASRLETVIAEIDPNTVPAGLVESHFGDVPGRKSFQWSNKFYEVKLADKDSCLNVQVEWNYKISQRLIAATLCDQPGSFCMQHSLSGLSANVCVQNTANGPELAWKFEFGSFKHSFEHLFFAASDIEQSSEESTETSRCDDPDIAGTSDEDEKVAAVLCNDFPANYPKLDSSQMKCVQKELTYMVTESGLKLLYLNKYKKYASLVHLTWAMDDGKNPEGMRAHFTCRPTFNPGPKGHHTAACKGKALAWIKKDCCDFRQGSDELKSIMYATYCAVEHCLPKCMRTDMGKGGSEYRLSCR